MIPIHLYHINDLHSHFDYWPQIVDYIKQARQEHELVGEASLVFDLGDHMDRFHSITEGTMGQANVELLNHLKVDYATLGNNEGVTFTGDALEAAYSDRTFELILANLFDMDGRRPGWCKPYVVHKVSDDLRIGITGVTAPFTPFYSRLGWDAREPQEQLKKIIPFLKQKADIVVVMSHCGLFFDHEIAELMDIDVILGSHTHHLLPQGEKVNGTLIMQNGKYGTHLGKACLKYDPLKREVIDKSAESLPMVTGTSDSEAKTLLEKMESKSQHHLNDVVAELKEPLAIDWYEAGYFPQLLADALREWCRADIGMINAGVLLAGLPKGQVTKGDIHTICPHPINPSRINVTGQQLYEAIERVVQPSFEQFPLKGLGFRGEVLGRMTFSNMHFDTHFEGDRAYVKHIVIEGEPLSLERTYSLATADMYAFSSKLLPSIAAGENIDFYLPEMLRDLIAWKLKLIN